MEIQDFNKNNINSDNNMKVKNPLMIDISNSFIIFGFCLKY